MPAWGCRAGMSVSCVCDLPWLQGSWLVRNDRLVHPLPHPAHHRCPISSNQPTHLLWICATHLWCVWAVWVFACVPVSACSVLSLCIRSSLGDFAGDDADAELRLMMSFVFLFRFSLLCLPYMFASLADLLAADWNDEFSWKRLGILHTSVWRLAQKCSNWLRGSLFISCVFSLFVDKLGQSSFSSAVLWYSFFFLKTAQWALPPPGLKTFI